MGIPRIVPCVEWPTASPARPSDSGGSSAETPEDSPPASHPSDRSAVISGRSLLLGRPEDVGELLDRRLEIRGRLSVDGLLVLAGKLEDLPDTIVQVRVALHVLGLEVV